MIPKIKVSNPFRHSTNVVSFSSLPVVYLSSRDRSKVALICGGGSGHEPAHAGFVGESCKLLRRRGAATDPVDDGGRQRHALWCVSIETQLRMCLDDHA